VADVPVLAANGLRKTFHVGRTTVHGLASATLTVHAGEMVAIRGRSGSGKTTLLTILGLLSRPDGGTIHLKGQDVLALSRARSADVRAKHIGFVFQTFNLLGHLRAWENVVLGARMPPRRARRRALELLEAAGLGARVNHRPAELSGGEQQRIALARALINNPDIVLADEPTGNLDADNEKLVLERLREVTAEGRAVLVASHSDVVCSSADRVISIDRGTTVE
jgi:ABC-type lipoprotein export system ATPase subunit